MKQIRVILSIFFTIIQTTFQKEATYVTKKNYLSKNISKVKENLRDLLDTYEEKIAVELSF